MDKYQGAYLSIEHLSLKINNIFIFDKKLLLKKEIFSNVRNTLKKLYCDLQGAKEKIRK